VSTADIHDSFMTVAEVAGLLKLNQQTVRNWIDQGSLPAVRVGRRVRIRQSDLERVLADGYSAGNASTAEPATGPSAADFWSGDAVGTAETPAVDGNPPAAPGPAGTDETSAVDRDPPAPAPGPAGTAAPPAVDRRAGQGTDAWPEALGHHDDDRR
jgi:excisionase family DNA binding protein